MGPLEVDMTGPDPTHEAAYARIRKVVKENKPFIDTLIASSPEKRAGNWKLALVKKDRNIVALRLLWSQDAEFRTYLRERMALHYGTGYTEALIRVFLA